MNQQTSAQPRTAPHLCGLILAALAVIFGLHFLGFHFVGAVGGSVGLGRG